MKTKRRQRAAALVLALLLSVLCAVTALAAGTPYTYTVTLAMGNQGSYSGDGVQIEGDGGWSVAEQDGLLTIRGLHRGDRVTLDQSVASLDENSKYYVKGVRISGRDNNTAVTPSFAVTQDCDYVVAYGIKGDLTQYTVRYVDEAGAELAESRTYYGNVGDKPVVAYRYIAGYQPSAYNMTKTLVSDSSQNVFTFVYRLLGAGEGGGENEGGDGTGGTSTPNPSRKPGTGPSASPSASPSTSPSASPSADPNAGADGTDGTDGTDDGAVPQPDNSAAAQPDNGANGADGTGADEAGEPVELIDLNDMRTPLGKLVGQLVNDAANGEPLAVGVLGLVGFGLLLLLLWLIVLLCKRRKKKKEEQESTRNDEPDEK